MSIWGTSIPKLNRKIKRTRGIPVALNDQTIASIPPHILQHHPVVVISIDVVRINGIPFLSTISIIIKLGTCTELLDTKTETIVPALLVVIDTYISRGFGILAIAVDYDFEAMRTDAII